MAAKEEGPKCCSIQGKTKGHDSDDERYHHWKDWEWMDEEWKDGHRQGSIKSLHRDNSQVHVWFKLQRIVNNLNYQWG